MTNTPEVQRLRADLQERLANCERYLRECQAYLDQQAWEAARERWERARAILPTDPEVLRLGKALVPVPPTQVISPAAPEASRRLNHRSQPIALGDHALVVFTPEVVLGNPLGEGVHMPMLSRLHRRHALLLRDRGRYRLTPCATGYAVAVNGRPISGPCDLADGDLLELGSPYCAWCFRLPISGSCTAVLEQAQPSSAVVQTPDGSEFRRVILADDAIHIRPRAPAHLPLLDLPCESLLLRWSETGLVAAVHGGTVGVEGRDEGAATASIWLPGRLLIQGELDEAERLGRTFLGGHDAPDTLGLDLRDPFQGRASLR